MFQGFEFNAKALMAEIKSRGWIRIAIQAPAGLLRDAAQLSLYLRERGYEPAVLVDPCFGACDLAETPESYDGVVHLGHAPFPNQEEAMFLELPSKAENLEILEKSDALPSRLGLVATVQHLSLIPIAKSMLEDCGHEVHVGDAGGRIAHPGQVLGCNTKAARAVADKVDAFIFIGSGRFHPGGVAMATGKKVYAIDPYTGKMEMLDSDRFLRIRHGLIEKAREGKRFGVLVSSKAGQNRTEKAREIELALREDGREAILFIGDNLPPTPFIGMELDVLVSTACPRIALDDWQNYPVPVLTPIEVRIMLGLEKWEDYTLDELA